MQFDWWTFAFQVINVLVLMWLLGRFMFRPLARIIAKRQEDTTRALAAAEAAKAQAAEAEAAARAEKEKNAAEKLKIIEAARTEAEIQRSEILEKSRTEAADIAQKAESEAKRKHDQNQQARIREAAALSIRITERLIMGMPHDARVAGYPERLQQALAGLDSDLRHALVSDPGALRIVAPRALSDAELRQTQQAIRTALDIEPPTKVEVDADMIAGLELRGRHGVIHNSLRYDLGRIAEAISGDD